MVSSDQPRLVGQNIIELRFTPHQWCAGQRMQLVVSCAEAKPVVYRRHWRCGSASHAQMRPNADRLLQQHTTAPTPATCAHHHITIPTYTSSASNTTPRIPPAPPPTPPAPPPSHQDSGASCSRGCSGCCRGFLLPALRLLAGSICPCSNNGRSSQACSGDFKQSARGGLTRLIKRAAC